MALQNIGENYLRTINSVKIRDCYSFCF